ncbi:MAG: hypothetical protein AAFY76_16315, partial [Cyanobacteria bacterium J06649_11]
ADFYWFEGDALTATDHPRFDEILGYWEDFIHAFRCGKLSFLNYVKIFLETYSIETETIMVPQNDQFFVLKLKQ